MAAQTTTLDQRLRELGRKKFNEQLDAAAKPLMHMLRDCHTTPYLRVPTNSDGTGECQNIGAGNVLHRIIVAALQAEGPRYEQAEVDDFLRRVDDLAGEVEEVRQRAGL